MASIVTVLGPSDPSGATADAKEAPRPTPGANTILPTKPKPLTMRDFGDHAATRKLIYDNVLEAASNVQPVSNSRYSLELASPHWVDSDQFSIEDSKKAILRGESLERRLRGTWRLKDHDGKVVDEKISTIARVPHLTESGTFIVNGVKYALGHQMRLRSGVFTHRKENGELESHINVLPGKGLSHHYYLEPDTGIFKMNIDQANLPLISVLRAMGVSDKELHEAWGGDKRAGELLAANTSKDDPRVIDKLYARLLGKRADPNAGTDDKRRVLAEEFGRMELDPEVTGRTLGKPHRFLTKEVALAATRKLLDISRGDAETDDRDALAYQNFLGPEDLIPERITRDRRFLNELLWKASTKGNLERMPVGAFNHHVRAALLDSGLGQALEEANALDIYDQQTRVSRMGVGAITNIDAIPDEARAVQPSHLGYIDLLRTPESQHAGVDSRVSYAAKKGSDNRLYSPFVDARTGQQVYKSPQDVADKIVAHAGEMEKNEPLVYAQIGAKTRAVPREKVDFILPHMEQAFSPINNLVPIKSGLKGQRAAMASRFITQALPLDKAEAPLVRGQVPGSPGISFEEKYGAAAGAVHAHSASGRVVSVSPNSIVVNYEDGKRTHELYNNLPYNRKTSIHNTPLVQPGDPVKPGQLLAKSNYTDDTGAVALGKNLRVAYVPYKGLNYEDAYVISESAAKKLTSEHMYQHKLEWHENHRRGRNAFASIFPGAFSKAQLDTTDDTGIVKPGTVVKFGDPLILAARERELSRKQVHAAHKGSFTNDSLTWEHHADGMVTDAVQTDNGATVAVKSLMPTQVGDKLCFDAETIILTRTGWKLVSDVTFDDEIATLNPETDGLEWQKPTTLLAYDHDGPMFELVNKQLDMLVTLEHKLWVARPGKSYQAITAEEFHKSHGRWRFKKDCTWYGEEQEWMYFNTEGYSSRTQTFERFPMDDWLEFMGYYIAEGWCHLNVNGSKYVRIGQYITSPHQPKIAALLTRMGLRYRYDEKDGRFEIGNRWLYEQLVDLGNSYTKYIPEYIQALSVRQLHIFFDAYMNGDGNRSGSWKYSSSSLHLMYGLQLICLKLGFATKVMEEDISKKEWTTHPHWYSIVNRTQTKPYWSNSGKRGKATHSGIINYRGKVFCVTVPNHIIYVMRRDKPYWSLNSGRYG